MLQSEQHFTYLFSCLKNVYTIYLDGPSCVIHCNTIALSCHIMLVSIAVKFMSFSCLYFCQPIGNGLLFFHSTVNVFELFTRVQQLGGYEAVGEKKLWKQLYEELSGSSSSSHPPQSAQSYASMMKRHYERYIFLSICTYCMIPLCLSSYLREGSMNQPENA